MLRAIFYHERARFAQSYPRVGQAKLYVEARHFSPQAKERDLAWCNVRTCEVHVLRRVENLSKSNQVALIRHELAHLCEPAWSEVQVDQLAECISGEPIRYDKRAVQTTGSGTARPKRLHQ